MFSLRAPRAVAIAVGANARCSKCPLPTGMEIRLRRLVPLIARIKHIFQRRWRTIVPIVFIAHHAVGLLRQLVLLVLLQ